MACYRLFQAEGRSAGVPGTAYGGSLASPGPPELAPDFFRGFFHEINHPLLVEHGKKPFMDTDEIWKFGDESKNVIIIAYVGE